MDRRDRDHRWYSSFDEKRMVLVFEGAGDDGEDIELPAVFVVCETCDGKGRHVDPGVDAHGLTRADFDEDPDFAEEYFAGHYDVPCAECHGQRVTPAIAEDAPAAAKATAEQWIDDYYESLACEAAERRMGA